MIDTCYLGLPYMFGIETEVHTIFDQFTGTLKKYSVILLPIGENHLLCILLILQ